MDDGSQADDDSSSGGPLKRRRKEPSAGGDRLSKLEDRSLGHILSFLPAKEAARAAVLSSRWRNVFAAVHTVSLDEPGGTDIDKYCPLRDPKQPSPFSNAISLALLARHRRCSGAVPLHALRVAMDGYRASDSSAVDQWVSYAVQQATPDGLDLDLRFRCRRQLCDRCYSLRRAGHQNKGQAPDAKPAASCHGECFGDTSLPLLVPMHTVTPVLYSGTGCAKLRSLSLSSCRLAAPATVTFPSLETLLLSHVSDPGSDIEWLINGCPSLADLTIEACDTVTELFFLSLPLRRLAVRCCHKLATVLVNAPKLEAFEYRGRVPDSSFLTMHGGSTHTPIAYCKIDICGEEVSSGEELVKVMGFLQLFQNAKHLHLESARLSSGMYRDVLVEFPTFSSIRHLELRGCLPDDDIASVNAVSRILEHTPSLETLSLFFHPEEHDRGDRNI